MHDLNGKKVSIIRPLQITIYDNNGTMHTAINEPKSYDDLTADDNDHHVFEFTTKEIIMNDISEVIDLYIEHLNCEANSTKSPNGVNILHFEGDNQ